MVATSNYVHTQAPHKSRWSDTSISIHSASKRHILNKKTSQYLISLYGEPIKIDDDIMLARKSNFVAASIISVNQDLSFISRYVSFSGQVEPDEGISNSRIGAPMTVEELECAVANLSEAELAEFRAWFQYYDMDEWDRQIAHDVAAGKLDKFAEEAIADYKAGRVKEL